jgi:hypothetical protein
MPSLTVETRTLGRRKALLDRWSVPIPPDPVDQGSEGLTLRQLIERLVRAEVAGFERRQQARQFVRVLSEREIAIRAGGGRVDPGGRPTGAPVDADVAVSAAMLGFEDGVYLVLFDGREQKDLDARIHLTDDSRIVFLRLTFLAGA